MGQVMASSTPVFPFKVSGFRLGLSLFLFKPPAFAPVKQLAF
jgi:hypothetical protein